MDQKTKNEIKSIDLFDADISLFRLTPCGDGKALEYLKQIRNSVLNSDMDTGLKPMSALITGVQGKRTHARCLLRGMGIDFIEEISAKMLHDRRNLEEVFSLSNYQRGYIISDIDCMGYSIQKELIRILSEGCFSIYDSLKRSTCLYPISGPIVLTAYTTKRLLPEITEQIDHIVRLGEYTAEQRKAIIIQRIRACNAHYDREEHIKRLADNAESLNHMVQIVKVAMTVMLAEGRTVLTPEDFKKAIKYI